MLAWPSHHFSSFAQITLEWQSTRPRKLELHVRPHNTLRMHMFVMGNVAEKLLLSEKNMQAQYTGILARRHFAARWHLAK